MKNFIRLFLSLMLFVGQATHALTGTTIQADIVAGNDSGINYWSDGDFEKGKGLTNFYTYNDGASATPVDCTGGTASTLSVSRDASFPMSGAYTWLIQKQASNSQGMGVAVDITVDGSVSLIENMKIAFDYLKQSGTFAPSVGGAASDIMVYLYDVTAGTMKSISENKLYGGNSTDEKSSFLSTFASTKGSTAYRLCFHVATTSAIAWVERVEGGRFSKNTGISSMKISTDLAGYTPILGGFTATGTNYCQGSQNGGFLTVNCKILKATHAAAEMQIGLPAGYTSADTSKIPSIQNTGGIITTNANGPANAYTYVVLIEPSKTYFTVGIQGTANQGLVKQNGNNVFGATDTFSFSATIPIAGASNINATTSMCLQDGSCVNNFSAKVAAVNTVSDENVSFVNGNCVITSTSVYTCTFDTSRFSVAPNCTVSLSSSSNGAIRIDSTSASQIVVFTTDSAFSASARGFNLNCSRAGADVKPVMQAPWVSGSLTTDDPSPAKASWVFFGSGTNGTTACSATPCTVYFQIGTNITSVVWEAAGIYRLMGIDGTKSTCMGTGLGGGVPITFIMDKDNSTTTYARMLARNPSGTATNSAYNSLNCGEKRP